MWGSADNQQEVLSVMRKINADAPSISVQIKNRIQIRDGRQIVVIGIQKTLCGDINSDSLFDSTCFNLKVSQVHVFCSKFSPVHKFCDDNRSKLVPESTQPGGFQS